MENLTKSPTQILQSPPKYTLDNVVARRMIFYDTVPRATDIQYGLIQFRDFWLKMRTTQYMVGKKEWNTLIVIFVNDFILALWCRRPIKPTIQINEFQPKSKFYEYIHTHTHIWRVIIGWELQFDYSNFGWLSITIRCVWKERCLFLC